MKAVLYSMLHTYDLYEKLEELEELGFLFSFVSLMI
jgi:hypothetical protein